MRSLLYYVTRRRTRTLLFNTVVFTKCTCGGELTQEWNLHPHVEVSRVLIESNLNAVAKDHPAIRVTTRVSRRFRFFFWNFALTLVSGHSLSSRPSFSVAALLL